MYIVYEVNTENEFHFIAESSHDAMRKMLYTLNLSHQDNTAEIIETDKGYSLTHNGMDYWVKKRCDK